MMEQHTGITFTPLGLAVLLLGGLCILAGPRRWVIPVFIAVVFVVSMRQNLYILGFNFTPHRLLLAFAAARVLARREHEGLQLCQIDKVTVLLLLWSATAYTLLRGSLDALKFYLGEGYDALGLYFLFRVLIRSREDMLRVIGQLAVISVVLAGLMAWEAVARRTPLLVFGGIWDFVEERQGRVRARAAFGHPMMAGLVGATLLPLWVVCRGQDRALRKWAVPGIAASTIIAVTAGSGTPTGAYLAGWFAICLWPFRNSLRLICWGAIFVAIGLQLAMNSPIWWVVERVKLVGGASGYHRANLIDEFVNHFGQWWAVGVVSTDSWGWDMWDVSNQFLLMAKRGGLLAFVLFIVLIVLCYRQVGRVVRDAEGDRPTQLLAWAFGAALFAHCTAFFGCAYWDQFLVLWYLLLAMIASLGVLVQDNLPAEASEPVAAEASVAAAAPF